MRRRKRQTTNAASSTPANQADDGYTRPLSLLDFTAEQRRQIAEAPKPRCVGCGADDGDEIEYENRIVGVGQREIVDGQLVGTDEPHITTRTVRGKAQVDWRGRPDNCCRTRLEPAGQMCQRCWQQRKDEHREYHRQRLREVQAAAAATLAAAHRKPQRPEVRVANACIICGSSRDVAKMRRARILAGGLLKRLDAVGPRCEPCLAAVGRFEGDWQMFCADKLGNLRAERPQPWLDPETIIYFDESTDCYAGHVADGLARGLGDAADTPPAERWGWINTPVAT